MPATIILQQALTAVTVLEKTVSIFFHQLFQLFARHFGCHVTYPQCCVRQPTSPSVEPKSILAPGASLIVCPGAIWRREPLETASQAELERLVSPRTVGSLGFRVTSATGPPGDCASNPGTWCSSKRSPGTMIRNFAPTRSRLAILPAGPTEGDIRGGGIASAASAGRMTGGALMAGAAEATAGAVATGEA